jgi:hypothetical protein
MKMSSVWLELFTRSGTIDRDATKGTRELVDGLKAANIHAIPWGYCFGKNSENADPGKNDLELAKKLCDKYKLDTFVADIEPGNTIGKVTDDWKPDALKNLLTGLNAHFGKENIGISSFANLNKQPQARKLLTPVAPLVSFCAPQIYWNKRPPVDWARKSLQSWRDAGVTVELVATVQSYWEIAEGTDTREQMTKKVGTFVSDFPDAE